MKEGCRAWGGTHEEYTKRRGRQRTEERYKRKNVYVKKEDISRWQLIRMIRDKNEVCKEKGGMVWKGICKFERRREMEVEK